MLVFYTDGICETQGRDENGRQIGEYGLERLVEVARERQGETAREVVDAIFASVESFSRHAPPDDDRTVMVVSHPVIDTSVTQAFPWPVL